MPCRQLRKWASILTGRKSSMLVHVLILGNRLNQMRTDPLVGWGVAGVPDGVNVDPQSDRMSGNFYRNPWRWLGPAVMPVPVETMAEYR